MSDETGLILPRGVRPGREETAHVVIDNRTDLADEQVQDAVETFWVENASLGGLKQANSFQTYASGGSMLARRQFVTPTTRREEITLARRLADHDDDIGNAIGQALAIAFSDGFENHTRDDKTTAVFDAIAEDLGGSRVLKKLYREYLIAGSVTTVMLPVRKKLDVRPLDDGPSEEQSLVSAKVGVIPAEFVEPIDNDLFDDSALGYTPQSETEREWLEEFFSDRTSPARKAAMRREDPVAATLYVERVEVEGRDDFTNQRRIVYRLNPRLAARTSMPKDGAEKHGVPLLARDFALLEAKRLLNIMDYALLQGASNYIVVAKKGTDERPAQPAEVQNLETVVRRASRTGVIVGDHRLSFEILTPNLDGLLNAEKRRLLSRKLAAAVLRLPEPNAEGAGQAGMEAELEFLARVIASDRHDLKEHVERYVYAELAKRNGDAVQSTAELWFPKIVLQGTNYFTDYVLKLRDRGDIPRKFAVQAAGFNWEAGIAQRKRELEENVDEVMAPAAVPFSSPNAGPQDNNEGRPTGTSSANNQPGSDPSRPRDNVRPLRTINRSAGETVKAFLESGETVRAGEQTYAILEQYPESEPGRVTALERRALEAGTPTTEGPIAVVPVNPGYEVDEVRAQRLAPGLSLLWGHRRGDRAVVAKALAFRRPEFDLLEAEETALRWGFPIAGWEEMEEVARVEPPPVKGELLPPPTATGQPIEVHVHGGAGRTRRVLVRDKDGNVVGSEEQPIEDDEQ